MLNEGDKIKINGHEYTLGKRIGGGKEGSVFELAEKEDVVVKIINDSSMTEGQRKELFEHLVWLANLRKDPSKRELKRICALPRVILDDHLGYAMKKATTHAPLSKYITMPEDEEFGVWYREKYTLKKRYQIIINLFQALYTIHHHGLIFTDLSPNNILIHEDENQIVFIDTDNIRKRTDSYLSVLGTPGYMAPEIYRKPDESLAQKYKIDPKLLSNSGRITVDSDIFSAAVIAFQLLTLWHPFIGDEIEAGTPEDEQLALEIQTDYIFKPGTTNTSTYALVPYFEELTTPQIRKLFERTFVEGKELPSLRPTDEDFLEAFQNALDMIVECPSCGHSRIYHPSIANQCIGCGKNFEKQMMLVLYHVYTGMNLAEMINSIGDYSQYNVSLENLCAAGEKMPRCVEFTRMLLPRNPKVLYKRHFEDIIDRQKPCARICFDSVSGKISLAVDVQHFPNAKLVDIKTRKKEDLKEGKEFPSDKYGIIFHTIKHGNGWLQIAGKFVRE